MSTTEILATKDPGARLGAQRRAGRDQVRPVGPVQHLADERERLLALEWQSFDATLLSPTIGAELSGIDLTGDLDDGVIDEIAQALADYKVVFFRDQALTPEQHTAVASRFGELEIHPFIPPNPDRPELVRFEKSAEVGGYENTWHHDVTWREIPSKAALLHGIEVPPVGGDTLFADMAAAYDGLDDDTKAELEGLTAVHDFMKAFSSQVPEDRLDEMREKYPLVEHPVVVTHDVTGRKLLYVNRVFTSHLADRDPVEGAALLDHLFQQAETVEYQVRFRWRNDSVAFWDNRAAQHYAASDYWPQRRVMERASIVGTRPTA